MKLMFAEFADYENSFELAKSNGLSCQRDQ